MEIILFVAALGIVLFAIAFAAADSRVDDPRGWWPADRRHAR